MTEYQQLINNEFSKLLNLSQDTLTGYFTGTGIKLDSSYNGKSFLTSNEIVVGSGCHVPTKCICFRNGDKWLIVGEAKNQLIRKEEYVNRRKKTTIQSSEIPFLIWFNGTDAYNLANFENGNVYQISIDAKKNKAIVTKKYSNSQDNIISDAYYNETIKLNNNELYSVLFSFEDFIYKLYKINLRTKTFEKLIYSLSYPNTLFYSCIQNKSVYYIETNLNDRETQTSSYICKLIKIENDEIVEIKSFAVLENFLTDEEQYYNRINSIPAHMDKNKNIFFLSFARFYKYSLLENTSTLICSADPNYHITQALDINSIVENRMIYQILNVFGDTTANVTYVHVTLYEPLSNLPYYHRLYPEYFVCGSEDSQSQFVKNKDLHLSEPGDVLVGISSTPPMRILKKITSNVVQISGKDGAIPNNNWYNLNPEGNFNFEQSAIYLYSLERQTRYAILSYTPEEGLKIYYLFPDKLVGTEVIKNLRYFGHNTINGGILSDGRNNLFNLSAIVDSKTKDIYIKAGVHNSVNQNGYLTPYNHIEENTLVRLEKNKELNVVKIKLDIENKDKQNMIDGFSSSFFIRQK